MGNIFPKIMSKNILKLETVLNRKLELGVDLNAINQYHDQIIIFLRQQEKLDNLALEREKIQILCDKKISQRICEFTSGLNEISFNLKEIYRMITQGGDAELELVNSSDPFNGGIVFLARPPKKNWKNITFLSGGEKTPSSLSLIFALHQYRPAPVYILDEVDSALDHRNVGLVGQFMQKHSVDVQFIVISLRNEMLLISQRLLGVFKTKNCSKSVSLTTELLK